MNIFLLIKETFLLPRCRLWCSAWRI